MEFEVIRKLFDIICHSHLLIETEEYLIFYKENQYKKKDYELHKWLSVSCYGNHEDEGLSG